MNRRIGELVNTSSEYFFRTSRKCLVSTLLLYRVNRVFRFCRALYQVSRFSLFIANSKTGNRKATRSALDGRDVILHALRMLHRKLEWSAKFGGAVCDGESTRTDIEASLLLLFSNINLM